MTACCQKSVACGTFNVANGIMGSGVLGLAWALAGVGPWAFLPLLIAAALATFVSALLLTAAARAAGAVSLETLGQKLLGPWGLWAGLALVGAHNLGAAVSYLNLVKLQTPVLAAQIADLAGAEDPQLPGWAYVLIVVGATVLPLAFIKRMGWLGWAGGAAVVLMLFVTGVAVYAAAEGGRMKPRPSNETREPVDAVHAVPVLAFAFACQPEILPVYEETGLTGARVAVGAALAVASVIYATTAYAGYASFGNETAADLLSEYPTEDPLFLAARLAFLLAVVLTLPLVVFPVRASICRAADATALWAAALATVAVLALVTLLAVLAPSTGFIFGLAGATTSPALIFLVPAIAYLLADRRRSSPIWINPDADATPKPWRRPRLGSGVLGGDINQLEVLEEGTPEPPARRRCDLKRVAVFLFGGLWAPATVIGLFSAFVSWNAS